MKERLDVVIAGAGFAGMYMLHRARKLGLAARLFMPLLGFPPYVERCKEVVAKEYEGFEIRT